MDHVRHCRGHRDPDGGPTLTDEIEEDDDEQAADTAARIIVRCRC